jgi:hypothetical protein
VLDRRPGRLPNPPPDHDADGWGLSEPDDPNVFVTSSWSAGSSGLGGRLRARLSPTEKTPTGGEWGSSVQSLVGRERDDHPPSLTVFADCFGRLTGM